MKRFLFILVLIVYSVQLNAQDPQLTQFYAAPQYLNPAFTGLTIEHRFVANYRNQWPGIRKTYQTSMAAYDYNLSNVSSGIGVFAMQDVAGVAGLTHTQAGMSYAYRFTVRKTKELRLGLNASYNLINLGFSKLTFNDQLITGAATSNDASNYSRRNYLDLGAGALYNAEKIWLGFSVKHLNKPNVSLVGSQQVLPMTMSLHGGYRYIIDGRSKTMIKKYFTASFNYRHELKYDQLDLGFYYFHAPLNIGFWYRGLPLKNYPGHVNNECLAILVGCEIPKRNLRIGYSYDLTISSLGLNNTMGAHEVSLVYEYSQKKKRKSRNVLVTCPKF